MIACNMVRSEAKLILRSLEEAVAGRAQSDVIRLADVLREQARSAGTHAYVDVANCIAAHYVRGNYERAGFLIADGLAIAGAPFEVAA
jgi:hypothetical protein